MIKACWITIGLIAILLMSCGCSSVTESLIDSGSQASPLTNPEFSELPKNSSAESKAAVAHLTSVKPVYEPPKQFGSQAVPQTQVATTTNGILNDGSELTSTLSNNIHGDSFLKLSSGEQSSDVLLTSAFKTEVRQLQHVEFIQGPTLLDDRGTPEYPIDPLVDETVTPIHIDEPNRDYSIPRIWRDILSDHQNFYSCRNLSWLGVELGIGAAMANTTIDQNLRDFYQENVRDAATDEFYEALHLPKVFGQGVYPFAIYSSAMLLGSWADDDSTFGIAGQWGERTLRGILLGGPPMLLLQKATGGSRPEETAHGSSWEFFQDNNGVSGHAFMGAMPFITAAQMTDNIWLKGTFYAASTLTGLSRINDDAHYSSQVFLGWGVAFLAVSSVSQTEDDNRSFRIIPIPIANGTGLALEYRY